MDDRPARVAWSALYAAVAAAIVWYRFVTPVRQALRHRLRVEQVVPEGTRRGLGRARPAGTSTSCGAEAGQFFRVRFLARGLWWASNPYSLSAAVQPTRIRITVKDLGDHSAAAGPAAARHPGRRRGPVRGAHRGPAPAAGRCC